MTDSKQPESSTENHPQNNVQNHTSPNSTTNEQQNSTTFEDNQHAKIIFSYKNVPAHTLVKTVDVSIKMLPLDAEEPDEETEIDDEDSEIEPFSMPLPIPPNCQLYKSLEAKTMKTPLKEGMQTSQKIVDTVVETVPVKTGTMVSKRVVEQVYPPLNCKNDFFELLTFL